MKLGVSSYSFRKYILKEKCDYIKICDLAKEMGFDGIEFTDLSPADGVSEKEYAEMIAKVIKERGHLSE